MRLGEDGVPCTWTHTPDHQRGPLQKTAEVGVCRRSLLGSGYRDCPAESQDRAGGRRRLRGSKYCNGLRELDPPVRGNTHDRLCNSCTGNRIPSK